MLEFDEARARWRELAKEDAGLGPIAAFHEQRLASLAAAPPPDIALDLTPEGAAEAIAAGRPLLGEGALTCETDDVAAELRRLARNLSETSVEGSAGQRTAERLATAALDVGSLLEHSLNGDGAAIARAATAGDYDPTAFAQLLELALQPVLWEAAARCAALTDVDRWDRGYCPVCGSWPALAELVGAEKRRVLRCGRCGTWWSWLVLLCPYCGNDDHRSLGTLIPEDVRLTPASPASGESRSKERIDVCERCHGYVKSIATFHSVPTSRLAAEDAATVHLDVGARERGYTRPGTVDVETAGIPRLVREGRVRAGGD
ncbi:MAG TPA: formate dehydrogenase accessory protein FdhE [Candidatus Limnocylindria bacterium]